MPNHRTAAPTGSIGGRSKSVHAPPAVPAINVEAIPAELRERPQWVVWRIVYRKDSRGVVKPTKVPFRARNPRVKAATDDPSTFGTFEAALAAYLDPANKLDGIGFVFTEDDPYGGFDWDHCVVDGEILDWALADLDRLKGVYAEFSPSGTGIKAWGRFKLPGKGTRKADLYGPGTAVEVYNQLRFFAVTGNACNDVRVIADVSEGATEIYRRIKPDKPAARTSKAAPKALDLTDQELIRKACAAENGPKFSRLYGGDTSGYPSASEADFALVSLVAFWTGPDKARIERIVSSSPLGSRGKWADRDDYRKMTIDNALEGKTEFYDPSRNGHVFVGGNANRPPLRIVNGPPGSHPPDPATPDQRPNLPRIVVGVDQHRVINEAETALAVEPNIFCRTNRLVRVLPSVGGRKKHHPDRAAGTPMIAPIEDATLGELLSRHVEFVKPMQTRDGGEILKLVDPPPKIVAALAVRGVWPLIRHLEGIIEAPSIRADGSIIDAPGWDEDTGLLYSPSADFGPIPTDPTLEDAKAAADLLLDLVCDVPFKDRRHAAAWLAALLTVVARFAVNGPVPMFIFDANLRSVGKSLLCDLIAAIVISRMMPRSPYPEDDAEMRKTLTSIAMVGDRVTMFDNISSGGIIGCAPIDIVLTGTTWKDRPLGTNSYIDMPWTSVMFATGNNIQVRADTFSRVVWGRIESEELRPEERKDFKVQSCRCGCEGDLVRHTMLGRSKFLVAALTILRAHAVAGRPVAPELPASRFPAWRGIIQAAVHWATGINPCETHEEERVVDQDAMTVEALVIGWKALCDSKGCTSLSVAAAIQALDQPGPDPTGLRDLFMTWSRDNRLPSSRSVGRRLAQFRKRPSRAGSLDQTPPQGGTVAWFVRPPKMDTAAPGDGAFGAIGGFSYSPSPTRCEDNCRTDSSAGGSQQTHQRHQTHQGCREVEL